MQNKKALLILVFLMLPLGAKAHNFTQSSPYSNSYERFFIYMSMNSSNVNCESPKKVFLDYFFGMLDYFNLNDEAGKFENATEYKKNLDAELFRAVTHFQQGRCLAGIRELKKYYRNSLSFPKHSANLGNSWITYKNVSYDFANLNKIYESQPPDDKILINNLIEQESKAWTFGKNISGIINFSEICDSLVVPLKFACYRSILEEVSNRSKDDVYLLLKSIKEKKDKDILKPVECHFINHEIGFFLGKNYGVNGASKCPEIFDECSFGCYHGIAEYLNFNNSSAAREKISIKNSGGTNQTESFESFTLSHGFGHAFQETSDDLTTAQLECDLLAKKNPKYDLLCYWGVAHELFLQEEYTNKSFEFSSHHCNDFKKQKLGCYYMLALTYSDTNYTKIFKSCKATESPGCFEGVGAYVDIVVSKTNLTNAIKVCKSISENDDELNYCLRGLMTSSIYFLNNITRAFTVCSGTSAEKSCYESLRYVYLTTWMDSSISFCDYLDKNHQDLCNNKIKKLDIA